MKAQHDILPGNPFIEQQISNDVIRTVLVKPYFTLLGHFNVDYAAINLPGAKFWAGPGLAKPGSTRPPAYLAVWQAVPQAGRFHRSNSPSLKNTAGLSRWGPHGNPAGWLAQKHRFNSPLRFEGRESLKQLIRLQSRIR